MPARTLIIVLTTYDEFGTISLTTPNKGTSVECFSDAIPVINITTGDGTERPRITDVERMRDVLEVIRGTKNSYAWREVRKSLLDQYASSIDEFARSLHRLMPVVKENKLDEVLNACGQQQGMFSMINKRLDHVNQQLAQIHASSEDTRRVTYDTQAITQQINTALTRVAKVDDISTLMRDIGGILHQQSISTNLASFPFSTLTYNHGVAAPKDGIQLSMQHDFDALPFGLAYELYTDTPKTGHIFKIMGPRGPTPNATVGIVYSAYITQHYEVLFPDLQLEAFRFDHSPSGRHLFFIRWFNPAHGTQYVVEVVEGQSDHGVYWYGIRGTANGVRHFLDIDAVTGVGMWVVGWADEGDHQVYPSGFERVACSNQLRTVPPRGNWHGKKALSMHERMNWIMNVFVLTPVPPVYIPVSVMSAVTSVGRINSGEIRWSFESFANTSPDSPSPIRNNMELLLQGLGVPDVLDGLMRLGQYCGRYAREHMYMPTYNDLLGEFSDDQDVMQLVDLKAYACNGVSKSEHARMGYLANYYHYTRASTSTIMAGSFGRDFSGFFCPACGCVYRNKCMEQLCNAIDRIVSLNFEYDDGIYPTVLGSVTQGYVGGVDDADRPSTQPIRRGNLIRCPEGVFVNQPRKLVMAMIGGMRIA
ncbi:P5 [Sclerotinia sclerotiorum mycoreovirus 4]|uniref:P5 n=1 Tax=Sclerotinia sclerotiorum mycoreovirus 4 TaxID=1840528 RepID=UPI0007C1ED9B|nr:P5 [Sclerotinia sclerotiorum mycoreovirus 4]ANC52163.1 P5 [Sclerotinia sclerotiorum mycoreovirus 4]